VNEWALVYDRYEPGLQGVREALCTLGNGYVCTRGAAPDCSDDEVHYPGTYIAGLYNRATSMVAGREVENEDLVNVPNWLPLTVRIGEGAWFRLDDMEILSYRQELDLREGMLLRTLRLRDRQGRTTRWRERRIVSMADQHLAAIALEIEPEDWSGQLGVRSALDGAVCNNNVARYRELTSRHLDVLEACACGEDIVMLRACTRQSRTQIVEAARTRAYRGERPAEELKRHTLQRVDGIGHDFALEVSAGERVTIEKVAAVYTCRDRAISEPGLEAVAAVRRAGRFDALHAAHRAAWSELWDDFDMMIEMQPDPDAGMKLRVHVFHLLQTVSPHSVDQDAGVPARGWHGEAYRGHIFWDELFIFPLLNLRRPVLTNALLRYRFRRLPAARRHAEATGFRGALYPWQSGSDGREENQILHLNPKSGNWVPDNTHRQRHINAAVAYNIWHYYEVTGDHEFMNECGAEMFLEIARFWASIATYSNQRQRYEIRGVMGPDEFHTAYPDVPPEEEGGIDNNAYTNVMASYVLRRALDVLDLLPPQLREMLREKIGFTDEEVMSWDEISRGLYVPFHDDGIITQFEGYAALEEFDWETYRARYGDIQRLDRILQAEGDTPNRYKASKQCDVLMLFYLFSADELSLLFERLGYPFKPEWIPRNIDYYLSRSSHGSTLSHVVHSWVLARSDRPMAWDLLRGALDADLADIQGGTTAEGIHLGAMCGTVDLVQRCLTGIETHGGILYFNPALPEGVERLVVRIRYRRHRITITVADDVLRVRSEQATAPPVTIAYRGHYREVAPGDTYQFRLIKRRARRREISRESETELTEAQG
jgi:alpha,alpha-trehalase